MNEDNIYAAECFERKTDEQSQLKLLNATAIEMPSKETFLVSESAYRRGFFQGAYAVLEAMQAGEDVSTVEEWINTGLYEWRYSRHGGEMTLPPGIKRPN